jgi:putative flippase GtrA
MDNGKEKSVMPGWLRQMVKYGIVGGLNTLITLVLYYLLTKALHVQADAANAAGYVAGFINSFFLNKFWTFKSRGDWKKESLVFLLVFLVCYAIQLGSFQLFKLFFRWDLVAFVYHLPLIDRFLKTPEDWAIWPAMVIYTLAGFVGNKLVTFREK